MLKVDAPTGKGKTKYALRLVEKFLEAHEEGRVLWITYRIILAEKAAAELKVPCYTQPEGKNSKVAVISMESLCKWRHFRSDKPILIILDEVSSLVGNLTSSTMKNRLNDFKNAICQLASEPHIVIAMDAIWSDAAHFFVDKLFTGASRVLSTTAIHKGEKIPVFITGGERTFCVDLVKAIKEETPVFLWCGSKSMIKRLIKVICRSTDLDYEKDCLVVTGDSLSSEKKLSGISPDDHWSKYRLVACSPALISGVSFTSPGWKVFVACNPRIILPASTLVQAAGRIRRPLSIHFHVFGWARQSKVLLPEDIEDIKILLTECRIQKLVHLRDVLGLTRLEAMDGYIIRCQNNDIFCQAILLHLSDCFRDFNEPYDRLVHYMESDSRYALTIDGLDQPDNFKVLYVPRDIMEFERGLGDDDDPVTSWDSSLSASIEFCADEDFTQPAVEVPEEKYEEDMNISKFKVSEWKQMFKYLLTGYFFSSFSGVYKTKSIGSLSSIEFPAKLAAGVEEMRKELSLKQLEHLRDYSEIYEDSVRMKAYFHIEVQSVITHYSSDDIYDSIIAVNYLLLTCKVDNEGELILPLKNDIGRDCSNKFMEMKDQILNTKIDCQSFFYEEVQTFKNEVDMCTMGSIVRKCCDFFGFTYPFGKLRRTKRNGSFYAEKEKTNKDIITDTVISSILFRQKRIKEGKEILFSPYIPPLFEVIFPGTTFQVGPAQIFLRTLDWKSVYSQLEIPQVTLYMDLLAHKFLDFVEPWIPVQESHEPKSPKIWAPHGSTCKRTQEWIRVYNKEKKLIKMGWIGFPEASEKAFYPFDIEENRDFYYFQEDFIDDRLLRLPRRSRLNSAM